ncbi:MAG TPA: energy transducer TonB, partial [Candidatus Polarisedimenticolia bacterium]|nr:energy transducer TonB [Candidatus Polarisedimenticolia bacterium]
GGTAPPAEVSQAPAAPTPPSPTPQEVEGRVAEFLSWAYPDEPGCRAPSGLKILQRWAGGLRVGYDVPCPNPRRLEAVLLTREGEGVWQVARGFEASPERVEAALQGEGLESPPGNDGNGKDGTALRAVTPPAIVHQVEPEYPEEAGRARLIGEARVELLVDIAPDGTPLRARSLRGPGPDLGMRHAATEAALRDRFQPALLDGKPVRYFLPLDVTFRGLPPQSRQWDHRALFHLEAIVGPDPGPLAEARLRLDRGEAFDAVAAPLVAAGARGGDWGFVSAASLPAPLRKALHEAPVGGLVGPLKSGEDHYLVRKRGEIYYAIRPTEGTEVSYQILHQRNAPEGEALRHAIERDIALFFAESRRRASMTEAARLMGIHQTRVEIGQLVILTDALDDDEIRMLGRMVEGVIRAHQEFWAPLVPLRPFNEQVLVYAFARRADHDALHRLWSAARGAAAPAPTATPAWGPAGEYLPDSRILSIPCDGAGGHLPVPTLIHEAIHMLDYERVYPAGVSPSPWFEEGLANYFGFSHVDAQLRIEPGDVRRSGTIVTDSARMQFDPRTQLHDHLRRNREEGAVPLRPLVAAGGADPLWSADHPSRGYGASWTLVQFLLHGERGRRRPAFLQYARAEAEGEGGPEAFARWLGPDLEGLEAAWHAYEEGM